MKRTVFVILVVLTVAGGLALAQVMNAAPPVAPPIRYGEPSAGAYAPPHWVSKEPRHYDLTDWRRVIDSTWGPGLAVEQKLAIFDLVWQTIDSNFACFNNVEVNWDSLRTVYRAEIEDTVSRGRFAAIMNYLGLALREGHTNFRDLNVNDSTALLPGVPVWAIGAWWDVGHFGAALTPLPDSSLLVYRVASGNPLGLERGDVVLGYDRRPWTEILRELQAAQLPVSRWWAWGSAGSSMTYSLLNAAGLNWHLFDTIDIVRYSTGDTVHLPTSLLAGQSTNVLATDQIDIPGVPMPDSSPVRAASYGIVSGTRIGYIYVWRWWDNAQAEFYDAVNALVGDTSLAGIIIDFRYNEGGNMYMSTPGLQFLFRDSVQTICFSVRSGPHDRLAMKVAWPASYFVIPGNGIEYDKPIAVLVGPAAISSGDQVALRLTFHPNVRTFGKSTNAAFNSPSEFTVYDGWYGRYATAEACPASDTLYYLTRREFPVDFPVWHTRDAVARGEDTVVSAAIDWIDSGGAIAEEPQTTAPTTQPATTIIRGVLIIGHRGQRTGDRAELLDISGRRVLDLKPGPNDVSRLSPGIYFVREAQAQTQVVRKVVVAE